MSVEKPAQNAVENVTRARITDLRLTPSEKFLAGHIFKWHPLAKARRQDKTWLVRTYPEMKEYGWYWGASSLSRAKEACRPGTDPVGMAPPPVQLRARTLHLDFADPQIVQFD